MCGGCVNGQGCPGIIDAARGTGLLVATTVGKIRVRLIVVTIIIVRRHLQHVLRIGLRARHLHVHLYWKLGDGHFLSIGPGGVGLGW